MDEKRDRERHIRFEKHLRQGSLTGLQSAPPSLAASQKNKNLPKPIDNPGRMCYGLCVKKVFTADQYAGYKWLGRKCLPPTSGRDKNDWVESD